MQRDLETLKAEKLMNASMILCISLRTAYMLYIITID